MVRDAGVDNLPRVLGLCEQEVSAPQPRRLPQGLSSAVGARGEAGPQPHTGGQHRQAQCPVSPNFPIVPRSASLHLRLSMRWWWAPGAERQRTARRRLPGEANIIMRDK